MIFFFINIFFLIFFIFCSKLLFKYKIKFSYNNLFKIYLLLLFILILYSVIFGYLKFDQSFNYICLIMNIMFFLSYILTIGAKFVNSPSYYIIDFLKNNK